jgi:hypothetical protein
MLPQNVSTGLSIFTIMGNTMPPRNPNDDDDDDDEREANAQVRRRSRLACE